MPPTKRTSTSEKTDHRIRWGSIFLSILGVLDSLYLLIYKYSSNDEMCLGSGDCATVNYSRYSEIYGIPVALLGMLAYLAILIILSLEPHWKLASRYSTYLVFGASLVGFLFSAYLTYIEFFVIFAICPFCIASAIILTMIFILSTYRLVKHNF